MKSFLGELCAAIVIIAIMLFGIPVVLHLSHYHDYIKWVEKKFGGENVRVEKVLEQER